MLRLFLEPNGLCDPWRAGHHADVAEELICSIVRVAVHITMLFSGDFKKLVERVQS